MNKRYQVFISSTYKNLQEERTLLIQTLLRKDCFPASMEWFPAIDEEQFEYIKQVIDDADYYVIILGGLYGTLSPDGKSYTEKEYDYAIATGKKIIALVQENPSVSEKEDEKIAKFALFRKKVTSARLVNFWKSTDELISKFSASLDYSMNKYPQQGWIRCDSYDCDNRLQFTDMNSKISSLNIDLIKTIHIMASGTSSYIPIVKTLLKKNKKKGNVNIYILFRLGEDTNRHEYLKTQYNKWWNNLKNEYSKIKFHFMCEKDFKTRFRGVVINGEIGLVGFYNRENDTTYGTLEDGIYIDKKTNVGKYILKCFLRSYQNQVEYPTLKSCVDNSI